MHEAHEVSSSTSKGSGDDCQGQHSRFSPGRVHQRWAVQVTALPPHATPELLVRGSAHWRRDRMRLPQGGGYLLGEGEMQAGSVPLSNVPKARAAVGTVCG